MLAASLARHLGRSGWARLEGNSSLNEKRKYRRALLSPKTRFVGGKKQEKERKKSVLNRERTRDPIDGRHLGCRCWVRFGGIGPLNERYRGLALEPRTKFVREKKKEKEKRKKKKKVNSPRLDLGPSGTQNKDNTR